LAFLQHIGIDNIPANIKAFIFLIFLSVLLMIACLHNMQDFRLIKLKNTTVLYGFVSAGSFLYKYAKTSNNLSEKAFYSIVLSII
jgi:hypothetical protein